MPSKHLNRARVYRPDDELYERAQAAVNDVGSTMNAHVIEFLRWLVCDTNTLPARPNTPFPPPPAPTTATVGSKDTNRMRRHS